MKIQAENQGQAVIVHIEGRLDSNGAQELESQGYPLIRGHEDCILDFSGVSFLSSAGIRILIKWIKEYRARDGRMLLAGVSDEVKWVLDTTGLLSVFSLSSDVAGALGMLRGGAGQNGQRLDWQGYDIDYNPLNDQGCRIVVWNPTPGASAGTTPALRISLAELGWSAGWGGLEGGEALLEPDAVFLAMNRAVLAGRDGSSSEPELVLSRNPEDLFLNVRSAVSVQGPPAARLDFSAFRAISVSTMTQLVFGALEQVGREAPAHCAAVVLGSWPESGTAVSLHGIMLNRNSSTTTGHQDAALIEKLPATVRQGSFIGVWTNMEADAASIAEKGWAGLEKNLCQMDMSREIGLIDAESLIIPLAAWIYLPAETVDGLESRMVIELAGGGSLPPEWEAIARRLYSGASRLLLDPLAGGYSPARPFRVVAQDAAGRRMLPTVLKVGPEDLVERELDAHQKYVEKYILNNATTVMGFYRYRGAMGLVYNFVGIGGPESRLTWLGKVYRERSAEELLPLFDRLVTRVLKPWYGQPIWMEMDLYREHVSAFSFFPRILEEGQENSGFSNEDPEIFCPFLGRNLPNPFHFLKYEYPQRTGKLRLWYAGICHGDMNFQNILLDETDNMYIIDFSETRQRNIQSDFARLEPIIKYETVRLESNDDVAALLQFEEGLAGVDNLDESLPFTYAGSDPAVLKAHQVLSRVRRYARQVTIFENDIIPYLLAVLEWTFPVQSYSSADEYGKRLAYYSAALIVEQIKRIEAKENRPS